MYNNDSRTRMSGKNFAVSVIGRIVGMITSFVGRSVFVRVLSAEYLGLGGFFGNIFSVISLCELGFGAAICQSLYKPLAEENEYKVAAVVNYFTRVYRRVAFATLCMGLLALPFLNSTVKSDIDNKIIVAAFLLFLVHSTFSYLLSPKCCLVVCDQRMYVVTAVRSIFGIAALVIQSVMLVKTGDYILYLSVRIAMLTIEDLFINYYADKKYPCLSLKMNVDKEYKKCLYSNVKALMFHKVGGVLSRSTDSILLTYFVGLSGMGKYSNYALVIGTVGAFFDVAVNAVSASVGNLGAVDRGDKSENVMRRLYFLNFWLLTVGTSVIVSVLNPFIELWLGKDMLFTTPQMLIIVSSFYFSCIRDPVQIFLNTYGLFRESRFIPIFRAIFNLVLSVLFVGKMGAAGVFLGTVLSTVLVPLCFEVKVLYKYGFGKNPREFFSEMFGYIVKSFISATLCFGMTCMIKITPTGLILRGISAFCLSNAVLLLISFDEKYFYDMINGAKNLSKRLRLSKL